MSPLMGKRVKVTYSTEWLGIIVGTAYDRKDGRWAFLVLRDDGRLSSYWQDSIIVEVA